jgi:cytochrome P450
MNTKQVLNILIQNPSENFQGWFIPKGTWVQGNVWAIHHNEREFPDPDRFNPNRYLKHDPNHRHFPNERGYMTFGWGRRVCSGQGLAEQGTFITIARLLWGFNIQTALGQDGKEIPVDIFDYTSVIAPCEEHRTESDAEMV